MRVAEGGKGIEEDKTGTEPDGGGGGVSAKGGCGDYRGRGSESGGSTMSSAKCLISLLFPLAGS